MTLPESKPLAKFQSISSMDDIVSSFIWIRSIVDALMCRNPPNFFICLRASGKEWKTTLDMHFQYFTSPSVVCHKRLISLQEWCCFCNAFWLMLLQVCRKYCDKLLSSLWNFFYFLSHFFFSRECLSLFGNSLLLYKGSQTDICTHIRVCIFMYMCILYI